MSFMLIVAMRFITLSVKMLIVVVLIVVAPGKDYFIKYYSFEKRNLIEINDRKTGRIREIN